MPFDLPILYAHAAVEWGSALLTPLAGSAATAVAIVLATLGVRLLLLPLTFRQIAVERRRAALAPRVQKLRDRHADDPLRALTEVSALYRDEGVGTLTTMGPLVLQAPFFLTLFSLFRLPTVGGAPNGLLGHELGGVPLGDHWLDGSLLGVHSVVFVVLFGLFLVLATVGARRLRRLGQPAWLGFAPYVSVVFAITVPLAAVLYLLTSTLWTTLENAVLRDRLRRT
ncbi:membrane protein insertase, YidC/Oxa1 family, C-terminal domain [Cryptosporangium arvum DSM 44712]|uniref:Membrane protein insertase YidC n=2 Tax=Cryptosporangium TaxID=65502 RepID=A0A010YMK5_9ACTN|nr:membrane protein insertase, YidC/Oxa1 family, C-terminal domain [Cryptosporangium arvum DSM 44712]